MFLEANTGVTRWVGQSENHLSNVWHCTSTYMLTRFCFSLNCVLMVKAVEGWWGDITTLWKALNGACQLPMATVRLCNKPPQHCASKHHPLIISHKSLGHLGGSTDLSRQGCFSWTCLMCVQTGWLWAGWSRLAATGRSWLLHVSLTSFQGASLGMFS